MTETIRDVTEFLVRIQSEPGYLPPGPPVDFDATDIALSGASTLYIDLYHDYLASSKWAAVSMMRRAIDDDTCQDCYWRADDVHHITYDRLGDEQPGDLVSLCRSCHAARHGISE